MGRTQFIALTSPCGGGIDMRRAGGPACSRSGGGPVVGRRVPSVPAGCPVRRLSSSGPSSLAGGVGVAGYHRWRSCPCTGCLVAGSGGGSVGAAAAGVDWSVGWVLVCCQCRSACWLAGVGVFVCCQCLSFCWLAGVGVFVCCQCLSFCWLAGFGVCGGRGSAVSARRGPPRAGLCCRPRCWPLVVLDAGRRLLSECCREPQR